MHVLVYWYFSTHAYPQTVFSISGTKMTKMRYTAWIWGTNQETYPHKNHESFLPSGYTEKSQGNPAACTPLPIPPSRECCLQIMLHSPQVWSFYHRTANFRVHVSAFLVYDDERPLPTVFFLERLEMSLFHQRWCGRYAIHRLRHAVLLTETTGAQILMLYSA